MFNELLTALGLAIRATQNHINQNLLKELVNLEKQQGQVLESLHHNIEALQIGPFHSGMACLWDAKKEHRTNRERYELVQQAKQHFITSLGIYEAKPYKNYKDLFVLGYIQSYIAVSWALLGKVEDSKDWLSLSKESLQDSLSQQNELINNLRKEAEKQDFDVEWSIMGGASLPAIVRPFAGKSVQNKIDKSRKTREELNTTIAFKRNTEEYANFINQSLDILTIESEIQSDGANYRKYIPVAQVLISNLANSETVQNDKLKSGLTKVSSLLNRISKE
ncbi:hypothetical protein [Neobacillus sp. YIM B06451]|uniref:hypothetical protein n=1 Tax=Neobacillus sp. YIM B06451 TaxID=3070994 RepID=UPI002930006D|nr:hypothetical protein [Neobacillus sp. YIM B06451]